MGNEQRLKTEEEQNKKAEDLTKKCKKLVGEGMALERNSFKVCQEIGKLLNEGKKILKRGEWGSWVRKMFGGLNVSEETYRRWMALDYWRKNLDRDKINTLTKAYHAIDVYKDVKQKADKEKAQKELEEAGALSSAEKKATEKELREQEQKDEVLREEYVSAREIELKNLKTYKKDKKVGTITINGKEIKLLIEKWNIEINDKLPLLPKAKRGQYEILEDDVDEKENSLKKEDKIR